MNFHPRIEEADEKQLYDWIQSAQPGHGSLASDELTRRKLDKLNRTIEVSERQNESLERSNYRLQRVMLALAGVTTVVAVYPAAIVIYNWIIINAPPIQPLAQVINLENVNIVSAFTSVFVAMVLVFFTSASKKKLRDLVSDMAHRKK